MDRRYRIVPTKDIDLNRLPECRKIVNHILNHQKGWRKYNVTFTDVTDTNDKSSKIIKVHFVTNDTMRRKYSGLDNLSAYDITSNEIYFNINNWDNGGLDAFDHHNGVDPLMRYRTYVVNHEFGHSLGLDHVKPKDRANKRGPIMMQMTKGKKHIAPCTLNEWPLEKEDFHELNDGPHFKTVFNNKITGGARNFTASNWILLLIIVLGMIVILICIKCNRSKYINQRYVRPIHDNRYFS